ncbi:MAG: pilus assembly protein [Muricomes sp.]
MSQSDKNPSNSNHERASAWGSRASVTVEAALIIPIFLFAILSLVYLLEIQAIRTTIQIGVQSAAKIAAEDAVVLPAVNVIKFKHDIIESAGSDRIERSILDGGSSGIHCFKTHMSVLSGEIYVVVEYKVRLPFPRFTNLTAKFREEMKVKAWTGYSKRDGNQEDGQIVYITDTALVYHEDYQCTYLQLSIKFVPRSELSWLRNEDGGKYYKCDKCVHGDSFAGVYITNAGGKYHNSLSCSGLKRTIYGVKKSEVGLRGGCSRCTR